MSVIRITSHTTLQVNESTFQADSKPNHEFWLLELKRLLNKVSSLLVNSNFRLSFALKRWKYLATLQWNLIESLLELGKLFNWVMNSLLITLRLYTLNGQTGFTSHGLELVPHTCLVFKWVKRLETFNHAFRDKKCSLHRLKVNSNVQMTNKTPTYFTHFV